MKIAGNHTGAPIDYQRERWSARRGLQGDAAMEMCERWQEAVSARLDGEEPAVSDAALDAHLTGCAPCREFAVAAGALDLRMAASAPSAAEAPDRSSEILAAVRAERRLGRRRPMPARMPRMALGLVGVVQLATSLPLLSSLAGAHSVRDLAAFQVALGVGFVVAAVRPATAAGLLPTAAALVAILAVVVVGDIAAGRVAAGAETLHATEVVGVALLWLLAPRRTALRRPRPA